MTFPTDNYRASGLDTRVLHATLATEWGGFGFPHYAEFDTHPGTFAPARTGAIPASGYLKPDRRRLTS